MAEESNHSSTADSVNNNSSDTESLIKTVVSPQSQLITVHLDEGNYLLWKVQVETAITGYGLEGYILGTHTPPPRFVTNTANETVSNTEFTKYQRQDSLICSWLLSSISVKLLP